MVSSIRERYEEGYVYLGSKIYCQPLKFFLERVGCNFMYMPTKAMWGKNSVWGVDLAKVELALVLSAFSTKSNASALRLAIIKLNRRPCRPRRSLVMICMWGVGKKMLG